MKIQILFHTKIEVYNKFPDVFSRFDNIILHLLSLGIQYPENLYVKLPDRDYKFITMSKDQKEDVQQTKFEQHSKIFRIFQLSLILDFNERSNIYKVPETEKVVVAVFSRLNFDQPTSMFLFAFHLLKKRVPKAKLFLYGKQNDEKYSGLLKQTSKILGIEADVVFKGHTLNIKKTIEQDQIALGWMNIGQLQWAIQVLRYPVMDYLLCFLISERKQNSIRITPFQFMTI